MGTPEPVFAVPLEPDGLLLRVGFAARGTVQSTAGMTARGEPFWCARFRAADRRPLWSAGDTVRVSGGYGFLGDPVATRVEVCGRDQFGKWETAAESPHGMALDFPGDGTEHISLAEIVNAGGGVHAEA